MNKCKLLVDKEEVSRRFVAWAQSAAGKKRIKEDAKKANAFIADFKRARNVSQELLDRRITI